MQALGESDAHEVGPYRLLVELRTDDTGQVLLGTGADGTLVVLTLVHEHLVNDLFRARLRTEIANATAGTHTVHVVAGDADAPRPWVATGFHTHVSLRAALERTGPLPESSVLLLADGLARALAEFHDRGLVHGHLTQDTVLLTDIGPFVVDTGIARATGDHTPADDLRAVGDLVVAAGGADLTEIVTACADGELTPAALREIIGDLPPSARPWPPAVRALVAEEGDRIVELIVTTGRRNAPPERRDDPPPATSSKKPLTRVLDALLVSAVSVFVGWGLSWVFLQDLDPRPLPDHAALVAQSDAVDAMGARIMWPLAGLAFAVFCTSFVLAIARPRTNVVPWAVLAGLTLLPAALWGLTFAGVDVMLVGASVPGDLYELGFLPGLIALCLGVFVATRLFPGANWAIGALGLVSLVAATGVSMAGLYFGWFGVVVAGVVPLDIVGVPLGCLAGSVVTRTLRLKE